MKKIFWFCFWIGILCHGYSFAQKSTQDLSQDSIKFTSLINESISKQYVDANQADQLALQALTIAENNNWDWAKGMVFRQQAFLANLKGDYRASMKLDNQYLQIALTNNDSTSIADALNTIGNDYYDLSIYDDAYYYFTKSYRTARSIKDTLKMAITTYNIARVLKELNQFELAIHHSNYSGDLSKKVNDYDAPAYLKDLEGDIHLKKGEFDEAEKKLKESLKIIKQNNIIIIEPRILRRLAKVNFYRKNYEGAFAYYDSATAILKRAGNEFGEAEVNLGISEVLIEQKKFDEAQKLIESSLATAQKNNALKMRVECYRQLSFLAERKQDYKNALTYQKNFKDLEDSLYGYKMQEKIFQDQLRLETEGKDVLIETLSKQKEAQDSEIRKQELLRNIMVVIMALSGILLFTVYRSGQRKIKINKMLVEHQKEMKKRSEELEQLNKVKDKFFSIISHDLRSPMNTLASILDLTERSHVTPEEFAKLTKEVRTQFNHTRSLINNLLDWALLQMEKLNIQPEKIQVTSVIEETFKLLKTLTTKEIKLTNNASATAYASVDVNMFNLIIRNLLMNAIKFSEAGGSIEVDCKDLDKDFLQVSVTDHGIGMSKDTQKFLFDKTSGYSTRGTANEKGTGLGLILCKEFVEKNGGKIWFESELGKGSTFYFTIKKANN